MGLLFCYFIGNGYNVEDVCYKCDYGFVFGDNFEYDCVVFFQIMIQSEVVLVLVGEVVISCVLGVKLYFLFCIIYFCFFVFCWYVILFKFFWYFLFIVVKINYGYSLVFW